MTTEPVEDPTLMVIRKYLSGIVEHLAKLSQNSAWNQRNQEAIWEINCMLSDWGDDPQAFQNMYQTIRNLDSKMDTVNEHLQSIDDTLKAIHKALTDTTDSA